MIASVALVPRRLAPASTIACASSALWIPPGSFYAHIRAYGLSHQGNISRFCTAGRKSGGGFYEVSAGFFCELARFYFLFIG